MFGVGGANQHDDLVMVLAWRVGMRRAAHASATASVSPDRRTIPLPMCPKVCFLTDKHAEAGLSHDERVRRLKR